MSLDQYDPGSPQGFPHLAEKIVMHAHPSYDQVSLMQFQVGLLSLAAALDLPALIGSSKVALVEAERLTDWAVQHQK